MQNSIYETMVQIIKPIIMMLYDQVAQSLKALYTFTQTHSRSRFESRLTLCEQERGNALQYN